MKNRVISILLVLALVVAMMAIGPAAMAKNGKAKKAKKAKVTLCHKAGPENQHTITVSPKAAKAHLAHGDAPGVCPPA